MSQGGKPIKTEFKGGRTKQAPAEACEVNAIVKKARRLGVLPLDNRPKQYIDVSCCADLKTMLDLAQRIRSQVEGAAKFVKTATGEMQLVMPQVQAAAPSPSQSTPADQPVDPPPKKEA